MTPLSEVLTSREEAVLTMLGDGLGLREIAERLGLSPWTIRNDRSRAMRKLGVCSQTHAVAIVIRLRSEVVA